MGRHPKSFKTEKGKERAALLRRRLNRFMEEAEMSNPELAKRIDVHPQTVWSYRNEDVNISAATLELIAEALGRSVADFTATEEPPALEPPPPPIETTVQPSKDAPAELVEDYRTALERLQGLIQMELDTGKRGPMLTGLSDLAAKASGGRPAARAAADKQAADLAAAGIIAAKRDQQKKAKK